MKKNKKLLPLDKVYASADESAIGRSAMDTVKKKPAAPLKVDERSADKYYGNRKEAPALQAPPPPQPQRPALATAVGKTVFGKIEHVPAALDYIQAALQRGEAPVIVAIAQGAADVLRRIQTGLDLLVSREQITDDQRRDVRFGYVGQPAPSPAPPPAPVSESDEDEGDPLSFLHEEIAEEQAIAAPVAPVVDPVVDSSPHETTPVMDTAADDFLTPAPEPAVPMPPTPAAVPTPRRPGRRSGRGAN